MIQLRDATAHVDFAEEQLRKFKKELLARYTERTKQLEEHHETARKELEEQFQQKVDTVLEDVRLEKDRMQRERRDLERDRKLLQKGEGERFRETSRMIDELKKKNENLATQNSKLRLECRSKEEKIKKRGEENEKLTKENDRLKKNTTTLERNVRQMRVEREKKEREEQMFAQAAFHRKGKSTQKPYLPVEPPKSTAQTRGRSVSWADTPEETLESIPETMKPVERHPGCTIYRDSLGETTRVTSTPENGLMFEYSNGDRRWATARNSVT
uniref:Uncharacterized protein n=1 Tax=Caenorhabditis japonica TaxID=281687 RepID=A0A8R1ELT7_CAEJA